MLAQEVRRGRQFCAQTAPGALQPLRYLGRARLWQDFAFLRQVPAAAPTADAPASMHLPQFLAQREALLRAPPTDAVLVVDALLDPIPRPWCMAYVTHLSALLEPVLPPEAQLQALPSAAIRAAWQAAVAAGLTWRRSRELHDFERFYAEFYAPEHRALLGDSGARVAKADMQRLFSSRGTLLWAERAGQPVSGVLVYTSAQAPNRLHYWKPGLQDPQVFGAQTAPMLQAFHDLAILAHAYGSGFRQVDFGLTRALGNNVMYRHKRDLGCRFVPAPGCPRFHLWLPPGQRAASLQATPLVLPHRQGIQLWCGWTGSLDAADLVQLEAYLHDLVAVKMAALMLVVAPPEAAAGLLAAVQARLTACLRLQVRVVLAG